MTAEIEDDCVSFTGRIAKFAKLFHKSRLVEVVPFSDIESDSCKRRLHPIRVVEARLECTGLSDVIVSNDQRPPRATRRRCLRLAYSRVKL